jgi:hypothetical protein
MAMILLNIGPQRGVALICSTQPPLTHSIIIVIIIIIVIRRRLNGF